MLSLLGEGQLKGWVGCRVDLVPVWLSVWLSVWLQGERSGEEAPGSG